MIETEREAGRVARSAAKKGLEKLRLVDRLSIPPDDYVGRIRSESDRGAILMVGTYLDDALKERLEAALSGATSEDRKAIFGSVGPLATFAAKALFAQALGLISPEARSLITIIRHLRNAAAHADAIISFEEAPVRAAALSIMDEESRQALHDAPSDRVRDAFIICVLHLEQIVRGDFRTSGFGPLAELTVRLNEGLSATGQMPFFSAYLVPGLDEKGDGDFLW